MKKTALVTLFASMVAMGAAYVATFAGADPNGATAWTFAIAMPFAIVSTIAIGAARADGRLGKLALPLGVLLVLLVGAFALALALPAAEPVVAGLPRRAAIVLYGVGILPFLILPAAYALTFREQTLRDEDLERLRSMRLPE